MVFNSSNETQLLIPENSEWKKSHYLEWKGIFSRWRVLGKENEKVIVFLHGFGASSDHWRFNAQHFAKSGFRVYAIDLIGFGKSDQPNREKVSKIDNLFWANQVIDFLQEIAKTNKNHKAILIGNSLGGLIALTVSSLKPELIEAVIASPLPDPALMRPEQKKVPRKLQSIFNFLITSFFTVLPIEIFLVLITKTNLLRIGLQFAYYHSIKADKELYRLIKDPAQRRTSARALRAMCIGMATRRNSIKAPSLLKNLSKESNRPRILLVWGRQDRLVPLIIAKRLINQHPWLKLLILENTGHCPHDESPNEFNQNTLDWLKLNLNN